MTEPTAAQADRQTLGFQAEVRQLLQLMIHSLYSNREIFLRELISNASDACDKLRFEALHNQALFEDDFELKIRIDYDPAARTLTIADNGVGMSRDEVITNLGTIAKSGTREFFSQLTGDQQKDAHLIGQFGVGFYSSFIVADKVTVHTRRAGEKPDQGVLWESDGGGEFTVAMAEKAARGTSHHASPQRRPGRPSRRVQAPLDHPQVLGPHRPADPDEEGGMEGRQAGKANRGRDGQPGLRAMGARRRPTSPTSSTRSSTSTSATISKTRWHGAMRASKAGRSSRICCTFPSRAPFDLWDRDARHGIKLYVRRVFIMDDAEQLLPAYLRFVRGVVDSNDLPLNVSREILQESKDIEAIRGGCTRKVLALLEELAANDKEKYAKFWDAFGKVLKEGTGEDSANKDRIAGLLRFASTQADTADPTVSLADYIGRMKAGQDKIYYVTADSFNAARNSPHLEVFRKKGIEVLLLSDRVDEWVVGHVTEFDGKALVSVAKGGLDLGALEDEAEKKEQGAAKRPNWAISSAASRRAWASASRMSASRIG